MGYKVSNNAPKAHSHALAAYKNEDGRDQPHHSDARYRAIHGPFNAPKAEDAPSKKTDEAKEFRDDLEPGDKFNGPGYTSAKAATKAVRP